MEKTRQLVRVSVVLEHIETSLPVLKIDSDYLSKIEDENLPTEVEVAELRHHEIHPATSYSEGRVPR